MSVIDRVLGRLSGVATTSAPPPVMGRVRGLPSYGTGLDQPLVMLRFGYGGLVLPAKPDERALWERYARETGRLDSLLVVHPRHPQA